MLLLGAGAIITLNEQIIAGLDPAVAHLDQLVAAKLGKIGAEGACRGDKPCLLKRSGAW